MNLKLNMFGRGLVNNVSKIDLSKGVNLFQGDCLEVIEDD